MTWIETPESSNVARFAYDPHLQLLAVEFKSEALYHYHAVPQNVFERMQACSSKGQFLARQVKGFYAYARVTDRSHQ